ncbi:unnamed protein product [Vitrella brassicaformis CCMP3155]|uniref:Uncharacterized protein n=1 Tax=Vitrella brassicaformis (strain CCMP3155) TaxID=1169540 RepID=A0A0G4FPP6_VITBC|nr:unnamed protein product [Vitrella brassicaformis CCMP3155]|eukprot:CEM15984.1 unnamed protein product [Vitrella brassicaformis CCMP3155]
MSHHGSLPAPDLPLHPPPFIATSSRPPHPPPFITKRSRDAGRPGYIALCSPNGLSSWQDWRTKHEEQGRSDIANDNFSFRRAQPNSDYYSEEENCWIFQTRRSNQYCSLRCRVRLHANFPFLVWTCGECHLCRGGGGERLSCNRRRLFGNALMDDNAAARAQRIVCLCGRIYDSSKFYKEHMSLWHDPGMIATKGPDHMLAGLEILKTYDSTRGSGKQYLELFEIKDVSHPDYNTKLHASDIIGFFEDRGLTPDSQMQTTLMSTMHPLQRSEAFNAFLPQYKSNNQALLRQAASSRVSSGVRGPPQTGNASSQPPYPHSHSHQCWSQPPFAPLPALAPSTPDGLHGKDMSEQGGSGWSSAAGGEGGREGDQHEGGGDQGPLLNAALPHSPVGRGVKTEAHATAADGTKMDQSSPPISTMSSAFTPPLQRQPYPSHSRPSRPGSDSSNVLGCPDSDMLEPMAIIGGDSQTDFFGGVRVKEELMDGSDDNVVGLGGLGDRGFGVMSPMGDAATRRCSPRSSSAAVSSSRSSTTSPDPGPALTLVRMRKANGGKALSRYVPNTTTIGDLTDDYNPFRPHACIVRPCFDTTATATATTATDTKTTASNTASSSSGSGGENGEGGESSSGSGGERGVSGPAFASDPNTTLPCPIDRTTTLHQMCRHYSQPVEGPLTLIFDEDDTEGWWHPTVWQDKTQRASALHASRPLRRSPMQETCHLTSLLNRNGVKVIPKEYLMGNKSIVKETDTVSMYITCWNGWSEDPVADGRPQIGYNRWALPRRQSIIPEAS